MSGLILFNKPYGVLCQFSGDGATLANFIDQPGFYAAGRLDKDSEGLVLLTNDGKLQARIANPRYKMEKEYWVQVDGEITPEAIRNLERGIELKDGMTKPAKVTCISTPLPERNPPIRFRASIPTSWISMTIREGKNRQVRRMTAAVGFPTLRLYRHRIGDWNLSDLNEGESRKTDINLV
jgi:23S rRNA pseudouridine2457 synthase